MDNTTTDRVRFRAEIRKVQREGFTLDWGEMYENIDCVAVTLFQNQLLAGALSLSDTGKRIHKKS